jgi:hypothetical protein
VGNRRFHLIVAVALLAATDASAGKRPLRPFEVSLVPPVELFHAEPEATGSS